jgi:hypothetical protein
VVVKAQVINNVCLRVCVFVCACVCVNMHIWSTDTIRPKYRNLRLLTTLAWIADSCSDAEGRRHLRSLLWHATRPTYKIKSRCTVIWRVQCDLAASRLLSCTCGAEKWRVFPGAEWG